MANKTDLVIVASPSKAKTIGKYLGPGDEVKASMGHVRDLPKSTMRVDLDGGSFLPSYQPIKGKEDVIRDLKKAAKNDVSEVMVYAVILALLLGWRVVRRGGILAMLRVR